MKNLIFTKSALVTGAGALNYLSELEYRKAVIVTGGSSMIKTGVIDRIRSIMEREGNKIALCSGIGKNPTSAQVMQGTEFLRAEMPDLIIAVGGGSAIDAAKAMLLFYEHPELNFENVFSTPLADKTCKTRFVAIPSTSGTASEVTHVSVVTVEEKAYKFAIKTENIRPDVAILDATIPLTLPAGIAAETGLDALTHAIEAYINKGGNDFTDALAKAAAEGLLEWLPVSCKEASLESREKVHNFQCMAGMAFSNCALGMVHGVAHAFGGKYDLAHGLLNAVILPYAMDFNRKDTSVEAKFEKLSKAIGTDVVEAVRTLRETLGIPVRLADTGISEADYRRDFNFLLDYSMQGATPANPIKVTQEEMAKFLDCVYYGKKVDF